MDAWKAEERHTAMTSSHLDDAWEVQKSLIMRSMRPPTLLHLSPTRYHDEQVHLYSTHLHLSAWHSLVLGEVGHWAYELNPRVVHYCVEDWRVQRDVRRGD